MFYVFHSGGNVNFAYIDKILGQPQNQDPTTLLICTLDVLNILLEYQPRAFTLNNIGKINKIMTQCDKSDPKIRKNLCELLGKIIICDPAERSPPVSEEYAKFYTNLQKRVSEGLKVRELCSLVYIFSFGMLKNWFHNAHEFFTSTHFRKSIKCRSILSLVS